MILAAQYYRPPFPERRYWKEDLDGMKDAGLNALQLWVLWSWVEPEPGRFVFDDYDDIVDKACDAWNFFEQDPRRIASITTRTWATVNN